MKYRIAASIVCLLLASCSLVDNNVAEKTDSATVWDEYVRLAKGLGFQADSSVIQAEDQLNQALPTGDNEELHNAYKNLGYVMFKERRWDKAIQFYHKSAEHARMDGNYKGEAYAYWNMGKAFYEAYAFQQAIQTYQKAIEICRMQGFKSWEGRIAYAQGSAFFKAERYPEAKLVLDAAYLIFQELNDRERMGYVHIALGNIAYEEEKHSLAIVQYGKAENLVNSLYLKGWVMVNTGLAYKAMNNTEEAEHYYRTAYDMMEDFSAPDLLISLNQQYGDLIMQRNPEQGVKILERNLKLIDSVGYSESAAVTLRTLTSHYERTGNYAIANSYLHRLDNIQAPFAERKEELERLNMQLEVMVATHEIQQNTELLASAEMRWLLAGLSLTVLVLAGTLAYSDRKRRYYLQQLLSRSYFRSSNADTDNH